MSCCAVDTLGGVPVGAGELDSMARHFEEWDFTDHWGGAVQQSGWIISNANGGATDADSPNADARHPGVANLSLDIGNVGGQSRTTLRRSVNGFVLGSGVFVVDAIYEVVLLPDATDDFILHVGTMDANVFPPANGFGLVLDRAIAGNTNWNRLARAGGAGVAVDTGIAAIAGSFVRLRTVVNTAGSLISYFIDSGAGLVAAGTTAVNITAVDFGLGVVCVDVAGAIGVTSVGRLDYMSEEKFISPPRP